MNTTSRPLTKKDIQDGYNNNILYYFEEDDSKSISLFSLGIIEGYCNTKYNSSIDKIYVPANTQFEPYPPQGIKIIFTSLLGQIYENRWFTHPQLQEYYLHELNGTLARGKTDLIVILDNHNNIILGAI